MTDYSVTILPLDPIVFGDNGLGQGAGTGGDLNVSPMTLHGAVGAFILKQCGEAGKWPASELGPRHDDILRPASGDAVASSAQLRGFCFRDTEGKYWFPRPEHFPVEVSEAHGQIKYKTGTAAPIKSDPAIRSSAPYSHLVGSHNIDEYEGELLVDEDLLQRILCNQPISPLLGRNEIARPHDVLVRDYSRTGIAIDDDTGRTVDGQLFKRGLRRFATGSGTGRGLTAGYQAWFRSPGALPKFPTDAIGRLGGDGRRAAMRFTEQNTPLEGTRDAVIEAAEQSATRGYFIYLLTAAIHDTNPVIINGAPPVAAALGKPWRYSGWNTTLKQPRPLATLVPAGSVYFFEWPDDRTPAQVIASQWLEPLSRGPDRKDGIEPALAGFGRTLVGVWS